MGKRSPGLANREGLGLPSRGVSEPQSNGFRHWRKARTRAPCVREFASRILAKEDRSSRVLACFKSNSPHGSPAFLFLILRGVICLPYGYSEINFVWIVGPSIDFCLVSSLRSVLGTNIAQRRKRVGLTQEQLAEKTGYSVDFISLVERGVNAPTLDRLEDVARELRTEPWKLLRPDSAGKRISRK